MHEVVRIASDLIAIPSVNPMGTGATGELYSERNVALHLRELFRQWDVDAELCGRDPAHPNLVARIDRGLPETVVLEAHMDTVSHLEMDIDPFDPVVRDGKLYGRGSCDTKGSMSTYLAALSFVLKNNRPLRRNVIFAAVHDEEFSFGGIRELVATDALRGASFAIVGEPTSLRIIHAHKGICRFHLHARGAAAHAAMPWLGDSAIYHMA
ncbi:MAG: M20/M25/M40 family metallo-hydrolase, partial [Terriglobus sp.]